MAVDKHGLKMVGLKQASSETFNRKWRDQSHDEIFYNKETGEVWTVYQYGLKTRKYDDPNIIKIGNVWKHTTMKEIADMIAEVVQYEILLHSEPEIRGGTQEKEALPF